MKNPSKSDKKDGTIHSPFIEEGVPLEMIVLLGRNSIRSRSNRATLQ